MLFTVLVLAIGVVQARHPTYTRKATPGDRTFDLVISYWKDNPDAENKRKVENVISNFCDAVFEATEGCHRIKTVRIYTGRKSASECDVLWRITTDSGLASATGTIINPSGLRRIIFADTLIGANLDTPEASGYLLAHEAGHYMYGLFDEYCRLVKNSNNELVQVKLPENERVPYSIMNAQRNAVNGAYEWLNFSVKNRGGNIPTGFGPWENTKLTWQHQAFEESCWETLVRNPNPSWWRFFAKADSLSSYNGALFPRPYYPELVPFAPTENNVPTLQLPMGRGTARAALNIIWIGGPAVQIILDKSGSMSGVKMDNVLAAAQNLIDIIEDGTSVGVIAFDNFVSVVSPIVEVTNDTVRAELKSAIAGITVGSNTAIGDAMQTALNGLVNYGISNRAAAVFLLTDGGSNAGVDPQGVVPAYQAADVPLFGFGYGDYVDPRLEGIALDTGGLYYAAPVSYNAVKFAFIEANAVLADRMIVLNGNSDPSIVAAAGMGIASVAEPVHIPFHVETGMGKLRLSIVYSGPNASGVSLSLKAPDSTLLTVAPANAPDGSILMDFRVDVPIAGEWVIVGERPPDTHISYIADAKAAPERYFLSWMTLEQPEGSNEYLTVVSLRGDGSIDGAIVTGEILFDNGETVSCVFSNFATGLYGVMNTATNAAGHGTMTVTASNPNGTAIMTWRDVLIDSFDGEEPEPPEDEPVTENFTRTISERVFVNADLYVDAGRPDDSGDGLTWESAFKNIQAAIDIAWNSATIIVTNGVYRPIAVAGNRSITIWSVNGAGVTVIDGGGTNRCAALGTSFSTTLDGFTLTNGWTSGTGGGALGGTLNNCILAGSTANYGGGADCSRLNNCVVSGNTAAFYGGGVCDSFLNGCALAGNVALYAGGAYDSSLNRCILSGNAASAGGGGAVLSTLHNSLLTGNTADFGGGAYGSVLNNCTLVGNMALSGAGGAFGGMLNNSIAHGNYLGGGTAGNHNGCIVRFSCAAPLAVGGENIMNIAQDPLFVDAANGNFRLLANSPCVNAGTNVSFTAGLSGDYQTQPIPPSNIDIDGNPRIVGGRVDMGAHEHTGTVIGPGPDLPVPLPLEWLIPYLGWQDVWGYADLALSQGMNGYLFWESYVAGLVPTDANSRFLITNFVVNAESRVTALDWGPRRADRVYKVWGKTNLTDGEWHWPTNDATRFFKVEVKMQ